MAEELTDPTPGTGGLSYFLPDQNAIQQRK